MKRQRRVEEKRIGIKQDWFETVSKFALLLH